MTEHRPHLIKHHGRWHCALSGDEWPRGIGETMEEAFADWERRWRLERVR